MVLVVGPSGAGKDTLIAGAKAALSHDPRFVFPRRLVTRIAMIHAEDHESVDPDTFERERQRGAYALSWDAHGLSYALPKSAAAEFASGRVVVSNVSRSAVAEARRLFPTADVVLITADAETRARRLSERGRESPEDIAKRLHREPGLPDDVEPVVIDNSGGPQDGIAALVAALTAIANR
jgi:phosphonate metabolism protein PhnN/1,5-bisphosphokinase (PRPP-forming)